MEILLVSECHIVCIGSSKPCKCINYGIYTGGNDLSVETGEFYTSRGRRSFGLGAGHFF